MNRKIQKANTKVADGSAQPKTDSVFKRRMKDAWETTKSVGRFARRHPILTVSLLTTALGSVNVANAQTTADSLFSKDKFRTGTVAPPSAFLNEKIHNPKPNIVKPRILGSENFESIELRDGVLRINGAKYANGTYDFAINIVDLLSQNNDSVRAKFPAQIPKGVIPTELDGHPGIYLIYEQALVWLPVEREKKVYATWADDNLFLNLSAMYLSPNGSLAMTTPSCLIMITPGYAGVMEYRKLGEEVILKNPRLTGAGNIVDVKDNATMQGVKVRMWLDQRRIGVVSDTEPLSSLR